MTPEQLAHLFHDTYERLAPQLGYETRKESAVSWEDVPEPNKRLMIMVAETIQPLIWRSHAELEVIRSLEEATKQLASACRVVEKLTVEQEKPEPTLEELQKKHDALVKEHDVLVLARTILDFIDRTRQNIELDRMPMPRTREIILIDDIETLCKQTMEG